jgi:hypothetical protein
MDLRRRLFDKELLFVVGRRDGWRFCCDWLHLKGCSLSLEEENKAIKEEDRKEVAGFEMEMECEGEYEVLGGGEGPPKSMSLQKPQKKFKGSFISISYYCRTVELYSRDSDAT